MRTDDMCIDVGIIVADVESHIQFYANGIGLPYLGSVALPDGRLHIFNCGRSLIKLYQKTAPGRTTNGPRNDADDADIGISYFTINISDLRGCVKNLESLNIPILVGPTFFDAGETLPDPVGHVRAHYAIVLDPDGNHVELLERV